MPKITKPPVLILGAVLAGIVLGMVAQSGVSLLSGGDHIDARVKAYIQKNPEVVIDAVNTYVRRQAEAERLEAVNLVSGDDGKTVLGNPDGDVTIYEFSDYNCGYCKRVFSQVMAAVEEDGNTRLVIKEFPILAESSLTAAQLSMAAAELGRFEEFHTALMSWQGPLDDEAFGRIISQLDIDREALDAVIARGDIDAAIRTNQNIARQLQLTGTPGFVIGERIAPGYMEKDQILDLIGEARDRH
jgi:protein-disulfide isomerase